ncbi:DUF58 domain-containing protein [Patulibacter brassicae]|uniref:DUF58 domain-containing protein n=1 Tax=Patulibacter brassicae TaxID=1705717 RepID=A0ABU4VK62_9ACTN|nr:DUF58 domain-containing protein [Patulibacter brassicae]MDX8152241.1 DUF58 domain-containing protein [Patulibacter brassicae]
MSPTPRLALVVAACAVAAIVLPPVLCLVLAALAATASLVDALLARRRPPSLHVEAPGIAPRGQPLAVAVAPQPPEPALRLRLAGTPTVEVRDGEGHGTLAATVVAHRRGRHLLPPVVARREGPLRLGRWDHRAPDPAAELRVLPDYRAAHRLAAVVRATGGVSSRGAYGLGTEFDHVREYAPEDDVRQVNWRATERLGRPMSNQWRVESDRDVVLLVDVGRLGDAPARSGAAGTERPGPSSDARDRAAREPGGTPVAGRAARRAAEDAAIGLAGLRPASSVPAPPRLLDVWLDAAAAVAATADALDDHVGAIAYDEAVRRRLPPRRGAGDAIVRALHDLEPRGVDSDHGRAFRAIGGARRAFVLVLTDLLDEAAAAPLLEASSLLARRHALCVATVEEPRLREIATGRPADEHAALAQAVAIEVRAQRDRVAARLRARGIQVLTTPPSGLAAASVDAYLRTKRRGL